MNLIAKFGRSLLAALLLATSFLWIAAQAQTVRLADFEALEGSISQGADAARQFLESVDPGVREQLGVLRGGDDFHYSGFSARTQIEALFNLAEAHQTNEGNRLIAKIYRKASPTSAAVALNPNLQAISRQFSSEQIERPLSFARPSSRALLAPLPPQIQDAIDVLSRTVTPSHVGSAVDLFERHLRLGSSEEAPRTVINRVIMESTNRASVFAGLVRAHSPPPELFRAMHALMLDFAKSNPAFGLTDGIPRAIQGLAQEDLPDRYRKYDDVEHSLPSRVDQRSNLGANTPVRVSPDYYAAALMQTTDIPARSYVKVRETHANYSRRIHSLDDGVPRAYRTAISSSRAARGVAVGADFKAPSAKPTRVFWLPHDQSPHFGRVAVEVVKGNRLAASRCLSTDSFESAMSVLWGEHGDEATFRSGEITILVSLDPNSNVGREQREEIIQQAQSDLENLPRSGIDVYEQLLRAIELRMDAETRLAAIPRGIVVHPALYGRELAWSAARVDFWFNDLSRVSTEGALLNGGEHMPHEIQNVLSGEANTWQFYERESEIQIVDRSEVAEWANSLRVFSRSPRPDSRYEALNHFAVSLFSFADEKPTAGAEWREEESVWRLVDEERDVQPLLDWAFANHHDFMRLNDFSEALLILRWIRQSGITPIVVDADGTFMPIATPDRVVIETVAPEAGT